MVLQILLIVVKEVFFYLFKKFWNKKKKIFLNKGYCSLGGTPETCKFNPDIDHAYKYWDKSLNDCVINVNYYFGKNSLFFFV